MSTTDTKAIKKTGNRYEITMNDDTQFVVTDNDGTRVYTTIDDNAYTPNAAQLETAETVCNSLNAIKSS